MAEPMEQGYNGRVTDPAEPLYHPFNKTLPRSIWFCKLDFGKVYETDCLLISQ